MATRVGANPRAVTRELIADAVFDHHVVPYLSTPLKNKEREVSGDIYNFDRRFQRSPALNIFEEAHKVAELYFGLASLSACNRHYRDRLKDKKKQLADRIIHLLGSLPKLQHGPPDIIQEAVLCGSYLNVLKIYFYYKPQALHSRSPAFGTPLHAGVNCLHVRSISFIAFVLQIDKKLVLKGNQSLLLVPDIADLVLESVISDEGWIFQNRPSHPRYAEFVKEQAEVKGMLAKHACELGIEGKMIKHAEDRVADNDNFGHKNLERVRDVISKAKKELASSKPPTLVKTNPDIGVDPPLITKAKKELAASKPTSFAKTNPDKPVDLLKKAEAVLEKKPSSLCSRIWEAIVYIGTCKWIGDFIKFLKKSFK